jgi:hypothetical protein
MSRPFQYATALALIAATLACLITASSIKHASIAFLVLALACILAALAIGANLVRTKGDRRF